MYLWLLSGSFAGMNGYGIYFTSAKIKMAINLMIERAGEL